MNLDNIIRSLEEYREEIRERSPKDKINRGVVEEYLVDVREWCDTSLSNEFCSRIDTLIDTSNHEEWTKAIVSMKDETLEAAERSGHPYYAYPSVKKFFKMALSERVLMTEEEWRITMALESLRA